MINLKMTIIIFILFCYLYTASYCSEQPDWLTDDESIEFFGTTNAPTYGLVEIDFSRRRVKRNAGDTAEKTWRLAIPFTDGTTLSLNLKKTDGVLANNNTTLLYARGAPNTDQVQYGRLGNLQKLGKFSFYQDYDKKASFVVFHDQNKLDGFIEYIRIQKMFRRQTRKSRAINTYIVIPEKISPYIPNSDNMDYWLNDVQGVHNAAAFNPSRDRRPTTVYPQLLIQLELRDVEKNLMKKLEQTLVYWNAVDMLYSNLETPKIKINIAGIIIPLNDFTTPWIAKSIVPGKSWSFDARVGLKELGIHFAKYKKVFPINEYDIMISITRKWLNPSRTTVGLAYAGVSCQKREHQVFLLDNEFSRYITAAHELAHIFSAFHTEDIPRCANVKGIMSSRTAGISRNFHWSYCDRNSFQNYFGKKKSQCFDNCPRTKPNCHNDSQFKFTCLYSASEICRKADEDLTNMTCDFIYCDGNRKHPISRTPEGTLCDMDEFGQFSACYRGKCIPVGKKYVPPCWGINEL